MAGIQHVTAGMHLVEVARPPVLWFEAGDEWLHRLDVAVAECEAGAHVSGHRFDDTTKPFIQIGLSGDLFSGIFLLLAALETETAVIAASPTPISEPAYAALCSVVQRATIELGEAGSDHEWSAVIGHRAEAIGFPTSRLAESVQMGPLVLTSSEVRFSEPGPSSSPGLNSWSTSVTIPLLVRGVAKSYSWEAASLIAARDLRRACALMSLVSYAPFTIREAPAPLEWGERQVPNHPPWYRLPEELPGDSEIQAGDPITVPPWLSGGWNRVDDRQALAASLDMYLEGSELRVAHPSMAAVAYTASIEAIAGLNRKPVRCEKCKTPLGIAQAFRDTLRIVLPEDEAAELDNIYGFRSKTVHAGRLYGAENENGALMAGFWSGRESRDFRWRTMHALGRAARLLIERELQR